MNQKKNKLLLLAFGLFATLLLFLVFNKKVNTDPSLPEKSTIYVNVGGEPFALHPSLCQSIDFSTPVLHMLFDGLTRLNEKGVPEPSIAKSIEVSPDYTHYLFHLNEAYWSNGTRLTAEDFVYSWTKILLPSTPSPSANQLYVLKNAKQVKLGTLPPDSLGVRALDSYTLEVELEHSIPYFLELTAMPFYLPINAAVDRNNPDWAFHSGDDFVCNGPYTLTKWKHSDHIQVDRNPLYWDQEKVHLDSIIVTMVDENTALAMFQRGELDWAGSPTSTILPEALNGLEKEDHFFILPSAGTHYYFFNTESLPFKNKNIRKAFAYSINRESIVTHLTQGQQLPATTLVPPTLWVNKEVNVFNRNSILAKDLFKKGLEELGLTLNEFPEQTLIYSAWERNEKIAQVVQQQWYQTLGVKVKLQSLERKVFLDKRKNHDFNIASGSWYSTFKDPLSFLELFDKKEEGSPVVWKDPVYSLLLEKAQNTVILQKGSPF